MLIMRNIKQLCLFEVDYSFDKKLWRQALCDGEASVTHDIFRKAGYFSSTQPRKNVFPFVSQIFPAVILRIKTNKPFYLPFQLAD